MRTNTIILIAGLGVAVAARAQSPAASEATSVVNDEAHCFGSRRLELGGKVRIPMSNLTW
jgi:hypothetical protein